MTNPVNFEVGKKYENRKGIFKVLAIDGDVMHISWKNGKEVATTVTLQSRILEHIRHELEEMTIMKAKVASKVVSPSRKARVPLVSR
jgi:hypothetical protein